MDVGKWASASRPATVYPTHSSVGSNIEVESDLLVCIVTCNALIKQSYRQTIRAAKESLMLLLLRFVSEAFY